jgi:hypothetical protein
MEMRFLPRPSALGNESKSSKLIMQNKPNERKNPISKKERKKKGWDRVGLRERRGWLLVPRSRLPHVGPLSLEQVPPEAHRPPHALLRPVRCLQGHLHRHLKVAIGLLLPHSRRQGLNSSQPLTRSDHPNDLQVIPETKSNERGCFK